MGRYIKEMENLHLYLPLCKKYQYNLTNQDSKMQGKTKWNVLTFPFIRTGRSRRQTNPNQQSENQFSNSSSNNPKQTTGTEPLKVSESTTRIFRIIIGQRD